MKILVKENNVESLRDLSVKNVYMNTTLAEKIDFFGLYTQGYASYGSSAIYRSIALLLQKPTYN